MLVTLQISILIIFTGALRKIKGMFHLIQLFSFPHSNYKRKTQTVDPDFEEVINTFLDYVNKTAKPKTLCGKEVNGSGKRL